MQNVRYLGATDMQVQWGACADPRPVLTIGEIYTVRQIEQHSHHTKFYLLGHEGGFPASAFASVTEQEAADVGKT